MAWLYYHTHLAVDASTHRGCCVVLCCDAVITTVAALVHAQELSVKLALLQLLQALGAGGGTSPWYRTDPYCSSSCSAPPPLVLPITLTQHCTYMYMV